MVARAGTLAGDEIGCRGSRFQCINSGRFKTRLCPKLVPRLLGHWPFAETLPDPSHNLVPTQMHMHIHHPSHLPPPTSHHAKPGLSADIHTSAKPPPNLPPRRTWSTQVHIHCDLSAGLGTPVATHADDCVYHFAWFSQHGCPLCTADSFTMVRCLPRSAQILCREHPSLVSQAWTLLRCTAHSLATRQLSLTSSRQTLLQHSCRFR